MHIDQKSAIVKRSVLLSVRSVKEITNWEVLQNQTSENCFEHERNFLRYVLIKGELRYTVQVHKKKSNKNISSVAAFEGRLADGIRVVATSR